MGAPRNEAGWWSTSNGCPTGKRTFQSRRAARKYNSKGVRMGKDRLSPYQCTECSGIHLGHLPSKVKTGDMPRSEISPPLRSLRKEPQP